MNRTDWVNDIRKFRRNAMIIDMQIWYVLQNPERMIWLYTWFDMSSLRDLRLYSCVYISTIMASLRDFAYCVRWLTEVVPLNIRFFNEKICTLSFMATCTFICSILHCQLSIVNYSIYIDGFCPGKTTPVVVFSQGKRLASSDQLALVNATALVHHVALFAPCVSAAVALWPWIFE